MLLTTESTPPKKSLVTKAWLVVGTMRYGTKRTDEILDKRAAFILAHPEIYSIHSRGKRIRYEYYDYKFAINSSEVMVALNISLRQAQRLLQDTRKRLRKKKGEHVGISEFCRLHGHNETSVRMAIVPAPKKK